VDPLWADQKNHKMDYVRFVDCFWRGNALLMSLRTLCFLVLAKFSNFQLNKSKTTALVRRIPQMSEVCSLCHRFQYIYT